MTQIYTILFDLDGTLVDTAPDLMDAHNYVMKKFGHKEKKLSDIKLLKLHSGQVLSHIQFVNLLKLVPLPVEFHFLEKYIP